MESNRPTIIDFVEKYTHQFAGNVYLREKVDGVWKEITQEQKDDKAATQKAIDEQKDKKQQLIADYASHNDVVHQLIDLALLQNGMLKGAALDAFLKRSIELIH